jgi:hypothetical protein
MFRNSLSPLLPPSNRLSSDPSREYSPIELGDFNGDNAGDDNGPRFIIPRKPLSSANVANTDSTQSEAYKHDIAALPKMRYPPLPSKSPITAVLRDWLLEIMCCFLVFGASLAIVATVYPYQDRPLPQWPYSLSINSLISIYAVTLKAAMLLVLAQGKAFKPVRHWIVRNLRASRTWEPEVDLVHTASTSSRS